MTTIKKYLYALPNDRIAKHPPERREEAKLLLYNKGHITHEAFQRVAKLTPQHALLFFNNTKVIAARLLFSKPTGAVIEVFLTAPTAPHTDFQEALQTQNTCVWKCMIGQLKKWSAGQMLTLRLKGGLEVSAELIDRQQGHVAFRWSGEATFSTVIAAAGHVPLPPYLHRADRAEDRLRYQTVFSSCEGAVAAPTAGLHFTHDILASLAKAGIRQEQLTLHVSAGTFRPVKVDNFKQHDMHKECIIIHRSNIEQLLQHKGTVIAVGTTALRTLESIYWYGVKLSLDATTTFFVTQDDPYRPELQGISLATALQAVLAKMNQRQVNTIKGETQIFIYPGYDFKVVQGLFTNFHQPGSTLLLLVAAFIGNDWERVYAEALANHYRFLSYGDTSLLIKP